MNVWFRKSARGDGYHVVKSRSLIVLLLVVGSLGIALVWLLRQPISWIATATDWIDDKLIDLEEFIYERAWVARSRLPAWWDK